MTGTFPSRLKLPSLGTLGRVSACADLFSRLKSPSLGTLCRVSACADTAQGVGAGRPLAAGPGRVTSSHHSYLPAFGFWGIILLVTLSVLLPGREKER